MVLKLDWNSNHDGTIWQADFCHELLTLRIDYPRGTFGIYDPDPVCEIDMGRDVPHWVDAAEILEADLSQRLHRAAESLDCSFLDPPAESLDASYLCEGCEKYSREIHVLGGDRYCPTCLVDHVYKSTKEFAITPLQAGSDFHGTPAISLYEFKPQPVPLPPVSGSGTALLLEAQTQHVNEMRKLYGQHIRDHVAASLVNSVASLVNSVAPLVNSSGYDQITAAIKLEAESVEL